MDADQAKLLDADSLFLLECFLQYGFKRLLFWYCHRLDEFQSFVVNKVVKAAKKSVGRGRRDVTFGFWDKCPARR